MIAPMTAMNVPAKMNNQSRIFSHRGNWSPNIFKCAAAGKITLTIMVQMSPTSEHSMLKDGTNIATANDDPTRNNLMIDDTTSMTLSLGTATAIISSNPSANGKAVNVNFENAVNIIVIHKSMMCNK